MPELYLDQPYEEESAPVNPLLDLDFRLLKLIELAKALPDSEVDDIIQEMEEKKKYYDRRLEEYFAKFGIKKP
ncbi:hypothetical protein ACVUCS_003454 [Salmonella enterica subsp. enterica]